MPNNPLSKEEQLQRRNMAVDLRRAGVSFEAIAARLNYTSAAHAKRDIDLLISSVLKTPQDEMRGLEALRLDFLMLVLWPDAKKGVNRAIDQVLKVMERRAKLFGLDAPVQVEQITLDAVETEIKRLEAELGTNARRQVRRARKSNAPEDTQDPAPGRPGD